MQRTEARQVVPLAVSVSAGVLNLGVAAMPGYRRRLGVHGALGEPASQKKINQTKPRAKRRAKGLSKLNASHLRLKRRRARFASGLKTDRSAPRRYHRSAAIVPDSVGGSGC